MVFICLMLVLSPPTEVTRCWIFLGLICSVFSISTITGAKRSGRRSLGTYSTSIGIVGLIS